MVLMDWDDRLPPNIVRDGAPQDTKLAGILGEVVYEMALDHPTWRIVPIKFKSYMGNLGTFNYPLAFNVYSDNISKKLLGEIGLEYGHITDERVAMTNNRIRKQMERSDSLRTSKLKVAKSHIKKWFVAPSIVERFDEAKERLTRDMYAIHREFMYTHTQQYRDVTDKLHAYVMDNLEAIVDAYNKTYTPKTLQATDVSKILNDYQDAVISNGITNASNTKKTPFRNWRP